MAAADQEAGAGTICGGSTRRTPTWTSPELLCAAESAPPVEAIEVVGAPDDATKAVITKAARALAYIVVANRRFTDLYEQ